jgi:hypothetical protein
MGTLTVVSEGWVPPHCACYLQYYSRSPEWLSFEPSGGLIFAGGEGSFGIIDTTDQSGDARTAVSFIVDDSTLWKERMTTVSQYFTETNCLGINDYCTFAKDLCQACGSIVTPDIALTPTTCGIQLRGPGKKAAVPLRIVKTRTANILWLARTPGQIWERRAARRQHQLRAAKDRKSSFSLGRLRMAKTQFERPRWTSVERCLVRAILHVTRKSLALSFDPISAAGNILPRGGFYGDQFCS